MLFFTKGCTFIASWYLKNGIRRHNAFFPWCPLFHNLKKQVFTSTLHSSKCNLSVTDRNVQTFLHLLMKQYQDQDVKVDGIFEIIQFPEISVLLSKKIEVTENIRSLTELAADNAEMQKMVKEEEAEYEQELLRVDEKILDIISRYLGMEYCKSVIMEVIPGVGGQEAMLFAKDLFNMYISYFNYLGFNYEIMDILETECSGLRKAVVLIIDENAYSRLMYEGGVHRVQRTPATEKSGRVHTSTVVVTILPEPEDVIINLQEKDLKIETMRSSGPGGQHVNCTNSAVRITHIPTGKAVYCQENKSQLKNKEFALRKLRSIIYEEEFDKQLNVINSKRKAQMGLKLRNEKIRTYNYVQDRITDHRISYGTIYHLKGLMKDGMIVEELWSRLVKDMQHKILSEIVEKAQYELK